MKTRQTIRHAFIGLGVLSLIFSMSCKPDGEDTQAEGKPVDRPGQIITVERAATLFKEYTERRVPHVVMELDSAEQEQFIPARYTDFDYEVIKQYISYIEQEAAAAKKDIKSLRIYYAVYPPNNGNRSKKSTVFLVPTTEFEGENRAFKVDHQNGEAVATAIPWDFGTGIKQVGMSEAPVQRQYATFGPAPAKLNATPALSNGSLILNEGNTAPPPWH